MKWLRIGVIVIVLFFLYLKLPVNFREYDSFILNSFYKVRGPVKADDRIVIAAINDASIVEYGDWPWTRVKIAEFVDSIAACKPSVILLNFYFRKKSQLTSDSAAKEAVANENRILAASIRKAGNVVIPFNFEQFQDEQSIVALESPPEKIQASKIRNVNRSPEDVDIIAAKIIHSPEPEIAAGARMLGFNNVLSNTRHYTLQAVRYGNDFYPSIGLIAACEYLKTPIEGMTLNTGASVALNSELSVPIDDYGISMINFCGPTATFPHYTASEILGKNFNRDILKDKIVIVGLTDKRNSEPSTTPYSDNLSATELWATIIDNILSRNAPFISFSSLVLMLILPLFLIIGLVFLTHACLSLRLKRALAVITASFGAVLVLGFVLFLFNLWLSILIPLLYLIGLAVFLAVRIYRNPDLDPGYAGTTTVNISNTAVFTPAGELKRIGRYQVMKELGSGSMGTVYKAVDPKINRTIAIKTLKYPAALGDQRELKERFSREAHAAGTLSHPNIVTIYDYGETDNMSYIAMEYLEGQSLEQKLQTEKKLGREQALKIISQIAEGLTAAHAQGIIHRDIKPSNIMFVGPSSDIKIMDFGVAKIESATMTETGKTLGTPFYMSPEQINGELIDTRSDIFSLGVIAYEILCGKKPFAGANLSALSYVILHKKPADITELCPELPPAVNAVFDKVLAKDRDERYAKAVQFATAFSGALSRK